MVFSTKEFNTTYSESRVSYHERRTQAVDSLQDVPNIIDIMLEPLKPNIFKQNGKINLWYIIWHIGKIIGAIKAALDERSNQKQSTQNFKAVTNPLIGQSLLDENGTLKRYIEARGLNSNYDDWLKESLSLPPHA